MPIINRDQYPDKVFFSESKFLEIGTKSDGVRIIQVGAEGDAPLVAFSYTDDPTSENLNVLELCSLVKLSQDPNEYQFYEKPKKLSHKVRIIYKFRIPSSGEFSLDLPSNAEILTIQLQNGEPCLWISMDPKAATCSRKFFWIRTGEEFEYENATYMTTLQIKNGKKVSHLFELKVPYSKLKDLLSTEKWREADLETFRILGKLCGVDNTPDGSLLHQAGIGNIPCSDLKVIDQLWLQYSQGHFGYTAQSSVFQKFYNSSVKVNQSRDLWSSYCNFLGWNTGFSVLNFSLDAPKGYLPATVGQGMCWGPIMFEDIYQGLLSRINDCNS